MRRLVLLLIAVAFALGWAVGYHRKAVKMARLKGQSLGLDQCREIFVKETR